jgi:F420-dependent oxidoreductase-like protein
MQTFPDEIRFGIHAGPQNVTYADYVKLWKTAETLGYDWASVFDHFMPIQADPSGTCLEGLTLLAGLAAQTSRIRCGILVVGNTYRHPAVLANIAATIDHISGGRLELGVGAAWYQLEHQQYGIPFHTTGRRIRMLSETAKILKGLWTQPRFTFKGQFYTLNDAFCEPKPVQKPHIPLWIGGAGEQLTLRVVAESADGWNTFFIPLSDYQRKLDVLSRYCKEVGRRPSEIRKSLVVQAMVRESEAEVQELTQQVGTDLRTLLQRAIIGTPEQCIQQLLPYTKMGVSDFIIGARAPADIVGLELVAKRVAPVVKREGKSLLPV